MWYTHNEHQLRLHECRALASDMKQDCDCAFFAVRIVRNFSTIHEAEILRVRWPKQGLQVLECVTQPTFMEGMPITFTAKKLMRQPFEANNYVSRP